MIWISAAPHDADFAMTDIAASTQNRILDAATEHLRRVGYERFRVIQVAADLSMSHGNIYRHYPSKEALADAVISRWLKDIERTVLEAAASPDPADDKLERMLFLIAQGYRTKSLEDAGLFAVFADAAAEERVVARRHRTRIRELLERALEEGLANGVFGRRDTNTMTAFLFDLSYRFIHPQAVQLDSKAPEQSLRARREQVFETLLRGLKTGGAQKAKTFN